MSEKQPAGPTPPPEVFPPPPAPMPADVKPSAGQTPGGPQPATVPQFPPGANPGPPAGGSAPAQFPPRSAPAPIEFAMAAPKKPFTIPKYLGCLVKMCFGFAVLLLMGYFALIALNPKAREWATKGAKDGSGGPTPFKAMNQILAIPAQAIGKTKDVVAAGDARVGMLDGVIAEEEGKRKKSAAARPVVDPFAAPAATPGVSAARAAAAAGVGADAHPAGQGVSAAALLALQEQQAAGENTNAPPVVVAPPPEPAAPAQVKLAGGIIISSASPAGGPVVRASFFYWIVNQSISGVFQSPPHRIMLDKRLVYEGQEINAALGITFDHLELANKLIVFRDRNGAIVTRSY